MYEGNLVPVEFGNVLLRVRAERVVVAAGALEQPLVFPGNDLVGVMLPQGVRRMVRTWSLRPGTKAVVIASDDDDLDVVPILQSAGTEVVRVVDLRREQPRDRSRPRAGAGSCVASSSTAAPTTATSPSSPA